MRVRLSDMVEGSESMWICTIHSMCVRILRMYAERLGYNKNFSIYSETERANVIKKAFAESGFEDEKLLKISNSTSQTRRCSAKRPSSTPRKTPT